MSSVTSSFGGVKDGKLARRKRRHKHVQQQAVAIVGPVGIARIVSRLTVTILVHATALRGIPQIDGPVTHQPIVEHSIPLIVVVWDKVARQLRLSLDCKFAPRFRGVGMS
jgi:hypothetical protein